MIEFPPPTTPYTDGEYTIHIERDDGFEAIVRRYGSGSDGHTVVAASCIVPPTVTHSLETFSHVLSAADMLRDDMLRDDVIRFLLKFFDRVYIEGFNPRVRKGNDDVTPVQ